MLSPESFFDLKEYAHKDVFKGCTYAWQAIGKIGQYIMAYNLDFEGVESILGTILDGAFIDDSDAIFIGKNTVVEPGAFIQGPCIIGDNCQVRSGAYIRGNVITGDNCIIGHTSELKNAILLNHAQCPHFNYVGDSIVGAYVNLGCGTILSNVPIISFKDKQTGKRPSIKIQINNEIYDTGLSKFGAVIGDNTETGCNSVLNPGSIVGKNCLIYPATSLKKGYYKPGMVIKLRQAVEAVERRDLE